MLMIVATLACLHATADVVVAVDMTKPRQTPRLVPMRKPLVAPAQWPRIGDEMRAGIQPMGESGYTLWLRGTKRFGEDVGGQGPWSPSGRYLMTRWGPAQGRTTTLRIFDRNGKLRATRRGVDRIAYWSYDGDALVMRQSSGRRTVWSRGRVPPSVARGDDRMDRVYRTLMRTIAKAEGVPVRVAEAIAVDTTFINSVVGAATYVRARTHETEDHRIYSKSVLHWCGSDTTWSRTLEEDEGGFVPVAGGWVCGTGSRGGPPTLHLLKGVSRVVVPAPGDVENRSPIYVH